MLLVREKKRRPLFVLRVQWGCAPLYHATPSRTTIATSTTFHSPTTTRATLRTATTTRIRRRRRTVARGTRTSTAAYTRYWCRGGARLHRLFLLLLLVCGAAIPGRTTTVDILLLLLLVFFFVFVPLARCFHVPPFHTTEGWWWSLILFLRCGGQLHYRQPRRSIPTRHPTRRRRKNQRRILHVQRIGRGDGGLAIVRSYLAGARGRGGSTGFPRRKGRRKWLLEGLLAGYSPSTAVKRLRQGVVERRTFVGDHHRRFRWHAHTTEG